MNMNRILIKDCALAVKTNLRQKSDQPVLIFLHEGLGSIEFWKGFPKHLSNISGLNYLVYDRPGYGRSDKRPYEWKENYHRIEATDYLAPLIEAYEISNPLLIGHSDGGTIALIYASVWTEKVSAVVTIGSHVFNDRVTRQGIKKAREAYEKGTFRESLQRFHGDKTDNVFYSWADTWLSDDNEHWDIRPVLSKIKCPVLAIEGENDPYSAGDQADEIAKYCGGRALILPILEHTPHIEDQNLTTDLIIDFLASKSIINRRF